MHFGIMTVSTNSAEYMYIKSYDCFLCAYLTRPYHQSNMHIPSEIQSEQNHAVASAYRLSLLQANCMTPCLEKKYTPRYSLGQPNLQQSATTPHRSL